MFHFISIPLDLSICSLNTFAMHHVNLSQSYIIPEHHKYLQDSAGAGQCEGAGTAENVIISDSSLAQAVT